MQILAQFCFVSASVYAFIGMAMGIAMAGSHDHTLTPVHAHLNLLGWVSMAIFGLFYQAAPHIAGRRIARIHVALATLSIWLLIPGIALANLGMTEGLAIIGSFATILSMGLFVAITLMAGSPAVTER
jgi:cbb3-type cytochrome oxidase subunit 1